MRAQQIHIWTMISSSMGVDFCVGQNHYQISTLGKGFWERFFLSGNHPTRKSVSVENIQKALDSATEFILYKNGNDFDVITREDFEQMVTSAFKAWPN